MTPSEPPGLGWVFRRALALEAEFPSAESWRTALKPLQASRLTSLAAHLVQNENGELPPDLRLHFEAARLMGESLARRSREQVFEAGHILDQAGISYLVFKGWPMAMRLYPSPAHRPSGDLDILVAAEDLGGATEAFELAGYRTEGNDRSYHLRLVREVKGQGVSVIELHHRVGPPEMAGIATGELLARRVRLESAEGAVWVPSLDHEVDLLVRHYLRHAGDQAILLLDILKVLGGRQLVHPLGSLIGDDLVRLDLRRSVDGPRGPTLWALRHWMMKRTFEQRRAERHAALLGIPLALGRSPGARAMALFRVIWPERPTPRWAQASATPIGRFTWRVRRAARFGR